jgi:DNA-directed RNA polymerase specialized sigma24 family protein
MRQDSSLGTRTLRWGTATREILGKADCPERRARVQELVRTYQPVMEKTALWALRKFGDPNATLDASHVCGHEVAKMLSPDSDYFKSYDPERRLRPWIKACIRHRVIDLLRRKTPVELDWEGSRPDLDEFIDQRELFEVFRQAMEVAEELCDRKEMGEEMEIFRAVRSRQAYLPPDERRKRGWTEWQERKAVSSVWDLIRDEALPAAAETVSETPEDALQTARELWQKVKRMKQIDLPEGDEDGME